MDQQNNPPPTQSQTPKQQVIEALKGATNVLVTVSNNPSVDQLAACIGLTLMLNKLDKHATAVFSGQVPSTLEFLQPEKTIETNTDSLRDFIISLDRAKADKLRYKVEDNVVKIFITPYRTSISGEDLQFSQGDFNVDVVMALGVDNNDHLDEAITSHGRILHDATVIGLSCGTGQSDVGSISWHEDSASSLSEMLVSISEAFQSGLLDGQMATSFLTGIVSETERFSNQKTSPKVMTMSAQLMAAGANQQLISSQLAPAPAWQPPVDEPSQPAEPEKPVEPYVPPEDVMQSLPAPVPMTPQEDDRKEEPEPKEELNVSQDGDGSDDASNLISLQEDITKEEAEKPAEEPAPDVPGPAVDMHPTSDPGEENVAEILIDEHGNVHEKAVDRENEPQQDVRSGHERVIQPLSQQENKDAGPKTDLSSYIFEPPANGGTFTGSTQDDPVKEAEENVTGAPENDIPMLSHESNVLGEDNKPAEASEPESPPIEAVVPEGPSYAPSLENSIDPSIVNGTTPSDPSQDQTSDDTTPVDPLAGMTPPVVPGNASDTGSPALPVIPPPSDDPATAPVADADAARQAVMSAMGSAAPLAQSPIAALNANPISLDVPIAPPEDPSISTPPPLPPPMMMSPSQGPGDTNLPAPVEDEKVQEPTNPFNLPPVH